MNKKGSAIIWISAIFLITSTIIVAITTISLSYHRHSIELIEQNQAYFTARSAVEMVANEITGQTDIGEKMLDQLETSGKSFLIPEFGFEHSMGSCNLSAQKISSSLIKLTANAKVNAQQKTVAVYINRNGLPSLDTIFPDLTVKDYENSTEDTYEWVDWLAPPVSAMEPLDRVYRNGVARVGSARGETYYYVAPKSEFDGNSSKKNVITPIGTNNVYIFVQKGAVMNVKSVGLTEDKVNVDGIMQRVPTVYIILEDGAGINLGERNTDTDSFCYIYSKHPDNIVIIGKDTAHNYNNFFGSVMSPSLEEINFNGSYIPPYNLDYDAENAGKWRIIKYEDK